MNGVIDNKQKMLWTFGNAKIMHFRKSPFGSQIFTFFSTFFVHYTLFDIKIFILISYSIINKIEVNQFFMDGRCL
jgi:hypothetical protein